MVEKKGNKTRHISDDPFINWQAESNLYVKNEKYKSEADNGQWTIKYG